MNFNYILLLLLISGQIFCKNTIQIVGLDNNITEYSISDIKDLDFELDEQIVAKIAMESGEESEFLLDNQSKLVIDNGQLLITSNEESESFVLKDVDKITFESLNQDSRYPFGGLEVDEVIIDGLNNPWGLDFADANTILFTEHDGRLFRHNIKDNRTEQINGLPQITQVGQGGLLDVTISPDFDKDKMVFLAYTKSESGEHTLAIGKGKLNGTILENFTEIFAGRPLSGSGQHFGSRIIFDNESKLYFSIGDRGFQDNAQDSTNHYGSVLRINQDGSIPSDNPYLNAPNAQPELYTMGNRNIQGMFYLSAEDEVWAIEHGPRGGDELNIIQAGKNYSWPLATYGINYDGTPITELRSIPGHIDPIKYWVPSIAPCGMDLVNYNSDTNELDIVIATLSAQELHRLRIRNGEVIESEISLSGYARFRDIQLSPDGYLYATTQGPSRVIRLKAKE